MGQFLLFLEQIVPSPEAHARTYAARFFADVAKGKKRADIPQIFYAFGPQLNAFIIIIVITTTTTIIIIITIIIIMIMIMITIIIVIIIICYILSKNYPKNNTD